MKNKVSYTKVAKNQQIPKHKRKTELICQIINGNKSNRDCEVGNVAYLDAQEKCII